MSDSKKKFDLGKSGTITCHVSADAKRLLIEFNCDKLGLTKTGELMVDTVPSVPDISHRL
jgi:hypothetical protein